ncbi:MAG: hypothetical protein QM813_15030 [Verrucomicrobiota bacterium]
MSTGWRCYDRDGKALDSAHLETVQTSGNLWSRFQRRLSSPRDSAEGLRLPAGAAFLEPVVEGYMTFDMAGLSLIELPVSIDRPNP